MIRHWSFYDKATGLLTGQVFGATDASTLLVNIPDGQSAVEGEHDHLSRRVDIATGLVVDYQPLQPNVDHEWDEASKRWKLKVEVAARVERSAMARARIAHLESNVQPRAQRELLLKIANRLGIDGEQSQNIDDEIAELRKHLAG